jgi:D-alanyl-D-alanine dipeptidase
MGFHEWSGQVIALLRFTRERVCRAPLAPLTSVFYIITLWHCSLDLANAAERGRTPLPPQFAYLREVDPTILQDIKYATARNFTGAKVPGYEVGECLLRHEVAEALKKFRTSSPLVLCH